MKTSSRFSLRALAFAAALAAVPSLVAASDAFWLGDGTGYIGPNALAWDNWYGEQGPYREKLFFATEYSIHAQPWLSHVRTVDFQGLVQNYDYDPIYDEWGNWVGYDPYPVPGRIRVVDGDWTIRNLKDWGTGGRLQMSRKHGYAFVVGGLDEGCAPNALSHASLTLADSDIDLNDVIIRAFRPSTLCDASMTLERSRISCETFIVGEVGQATLEMKGGSNLSVESRMHIGNYNQYHYAGQNPVETRASRVTVSGLDTSIDAHGYLEVAPLGSASLEVLNGGRVSVADAIHAGGEGAHASFRVDGTDSRLEAGSFFYHGADRGARLDIEVSDGGRMTVGGGQMALGANAGVVVEGENSLLKAPEMPLGYLGRVDLTVRDGGALNAASLRLGGFGTADTGGTIELDGGHVTIDNGSRYAAFQMMGRGDLKVQNGSTFEVRGDGELTIGFSNGSAATALVSNSSMVSRRLSVGAGNSNVSGSLDVADGAQVEASTLWIGADATGVKGAVAVRDGARLDVLPGIGGATIPRGRIFVYKDDLLDVSQGGYARAGSDRWVENALVVGAKGFLGGSGTVKGNLIVEDGGEVGPGSSPGTLHIDGDAALGGALLMEVARTSTGVVSHDLLAVTGDVTLGGTLNVTFAGTLGTDRLTLVSGRNVFGSFAHVNLPAGFQFFTSGGEAWVQTQAVPEPASLAALSLGALVLLRRRRK